MINRKRFIELNIEDKIYVFNSYHITIATLTVTGLKLESNEIELYCDGRDLLLCKVDKNATLNSLINSDNKIATTREELLSFFNEAILKTITEEEEAIKNKLERIENLKLSLK